MCPLCKQPVALKVRPFCSQKCADIDLGRWFSGHYRLPSLHVEDPHSQEFTAVSSDIFPEE